MCLIGWKVKSHNALQAWSGFLHVLIEWPAQGSVLSLTAHPSQQPCIRNTETFKCKSWKHVFMGQHTVFKVNIMHTGLRKNVHACVCGTIEWLTDKNQQQPTNKQSRPFLANGVYIFSLTTCKNTVEERLKSFCAINSNGMPFIFYFLSFTFSHLQKGGKQTNNTCVRIIRSRPMCTSDCPNTNNMTQ